MIGGSVGEHWYYPVGPLFDSPGAYASSRWHSSSRAAVAVRSRDPRAWAPALVAAIVLSLGLVPSFSQAAFVAVAIATVRFVGVWSARSFAPAAVVLTIGAAVAGSFAPSCDGDVLDVPGPGLPASVYDAIQTALDHPVAGLGSAAARCRTP